MKTVVVIASLLAAMALVFWTVSSSLATTQTMQIQIDDLTIQRNNLQIEISNLQNQIDSLNTQLAEKEGQIQSLDQQLALLWEYIAENYW